ncbi:DUF2087 domain-containing protein [Aminobacter anthyllidis]|uniref:DUF2087 domain-containing protein n=1 Tax=Aminobacter anthyllidis TaxID=1035067 RepID=A0A9X1AAS2_9HYPH|nr:DUF2087 domain-containing protein [Aminobacter anthyllidis]MBT1156320.1 DUF2087 domain-containing protein [Aminobacter anthyllidis]
MTALITDDGIVTRWPAKAADRVVVLDFLAARFERGLDYAEREVNDILKRHHSFGDWALLRRELVETGRFRRDAVAGLYWLPPAVSHAF